VAASIINCTHFCPKKITNGRTIRLYNGNSEQPVL
jgi:hypothetical protein